MQYGFLYSEEKNLTQDWEHSVFLKNNPALVQFSKCYFFF